MTGDPIRREGDRLRSPYLWLLFTHGAVCVVSLAILLWLLFFSPEQRHYKAKMDLLHEMRQETRQLREEIGALKAKTKANEKKLGGREDDRR